MAPPTSIKLPFERIERSLKQIVRKDGNTDELRVEIGELVNNLVLNMDRIMNDVFKRFGENPTENKPNIYFPVCASSVKLDERMQQYRLSNIKAQQPKIYDAIRSVQPFAEGSPQWWKQLSQTSKTRHEGHPEIEAKKVPGLILGSEGKSIHIDRFVFDASRKMIHLDGYEIDGRTGARSKVSIRPTEMRAEILSGTDMDPVEFVSKCLEQARAMAKTIYDNTI